MKHIVIGAHGNLAEAFLETVRMIAGTEQTSCIHAIGMKENMDPQAFIKKAEELIDEDRDGEYLLLADLFGASPCNSLLMACLLYTSPSPRDGLLSRMPSSA